MYAIFAVFRQADLVLLEAGLNGGLYKQQPGQTLTLGAAFPTLCEKCMDTLPEVIVISPYNIHTLSSHHVMRIFKLIRKLS